jgi:hypothetical protein
MMGSQIINAAVTSCFISCASPEQYSQQGRKRRRAR